MSTTRPHYFEAHITITSEDQSKAEVIAVSQGWHLSRIADDEVLGPGVKTYLTKSTPEFKRLHDNMMWVVNALIINGVRVLRYKIESALIDVVIE